MLVWCGASAVGVSSDWPCWRGPQHNGVASSGQSLPGQWSETENVLWKTPVPGRGHGAATVVGDAIYLATAEREREARSILCLDRVTGERRWLCDVHVGDLTPHKNEKASDASCTIACDGERLYVNFLHAGGMYTSAVSLTGKVLWQTRVCDYTVHQGYGSSPFLHESLVLVTADNKQGGKVAALQRTDGTVVWSHDRPEKPNYASPLVQEVAGRAQLLLTGCDLVSSYDPSTGERLWEVEGATTECVTTTLVCGGLMFTSGGYPTNHVSAVKCDGTGETAWRNETRVYVPSMLVKDGRLYAVADAGFAVCWDCQTGEEQWKGRLGGTFSASPVLVDDRIYATNEGGETYVFRASPDKFELLGKHTLGDECFATPTICGSRIYMRAAVREGDVRQEYLYCVGVGN
ncbi:MAG: PQQ-binding-like beta-propeller repeat protein [Planctomycetaceae bacterium]|nr:PQQ-binding-like beta-propeller repeat protein [Planctomycetaceae bacterium]